MVNRCRLGAYFSSSSAPMDGQWLIHQPDCRSGVCPPLGHVDCLFGSVGCVACSFPASALTLSHKYENGRRLAPVFISSVLRRDANSHRAEQDLHPTVDARIANRGIARDVFRCALAQKLHPNGLRAAFGKLFGCAAGALLVQIRGALIL